MDSSTAARAAIREIRNNRPSVEDPSFRKTAAATLENLGLPRWILRAIALSIVGIALSTAVANMPSRHEVNGKATLDGKPLGKVTVRLESPHGSYVACAGEDGYFEMKGIRPGIYAVSVRPGESGRSIPDRYRSTHTTPLRFEIREDLEGMQITVRGNR
jgi:hypothetical protein